MEIFSLFLYSPMWGEKRKIDIFSIAKFASPLDLTHWGRVTHICVSKLTIIGYSGLSGSEAIWRLNGSWSSMIQVIIWHLFVTKPLPEPILTQYWMSSAKHISINFSSNHYNSLFENLSTFSSDYFDFSQFNNCRMSAILLRLETKVAIKKSSGWHQWEQVHWGTILISYSLRVRRSEVPT